MHVFTDLVRATDLGEWSLKRGGLKSHATVNFIPSIRRFILLLFKKTHLNKGYKHKDKTHMEKTGFSIEAHE